MMTLNVLDCMYMYGLACRTHLVCMYVCTYPVPPAQGAMYVYQTSRRWVALEVAAQRDSQSIMEGATCMYT